MTSLDAPMLRPAGPADAPRVARLHADSWRRHYRGAYSDAFLDGDVGADRLAVWSERLADADGSCATILAEDGDTLVGFLHVVFDADLEWGSLIDNLHVAAPRQRSGVGSGLMARAAGAVIERPSTRGLHLWVLEQNARARAFYEARGGMRTGSAPVGPPGGVEGRLNGAPQKLRYVWREPSVLLGSR